MTDARVDARPKVDERVAIAVVDPEDAVRSVLAKHIAELDVEATGFDDFDTLVDRTDPLTPVVAVVGPSLGPENLILQARDLISLRPTVGVVMVVFDLTPEVLQQALRAGVDDVVAVSAEDLELTDAVARATSRLLSRAPVAQSPVEVPTPQAHSREGRVVTVFCTKGGAGKSVIAVNLAVALARRSSKPVVLVDADLQFGDVALMLELQPTHTVAEAVAAGDRLDAALLASLTLKHEPSGLLVLAAPTEPGPADHIGKADLARVLAVLRSECEYIVVDTSANFGEITLSALQQADDILVVAGLDVMSLKSAKVGLQTMRVLGISFSKIKFVLNRANTQVGLSNADAERVLQLKVDVALPSDLVVAASVNRGTPVVLGAPKSKFARGIDELATKLAVRARSSGSQE
jgi:pilus assembly protein CpaE